MRIRKAWGERGALWISAAIGIAALMASLSVWASEESTQQDPMDSVTPSTPDPTPAGSKSPEDKVRDRLNNTRWIAELKPLSGPGKTLQDTLTFEGRQISSERLGKSGYPASNYSLTIDSEDVAVWETMQTKEGEGVVFWRGELHQDTMRGVMSRHPSEGASQDFSFTAHQQSAAVMKEENSAGGAAVPSNGTASMDSQPVSKEPESVAEQSPPKKKRRGWFGR